jgi:ABC-type uncharacterized transport system permease subunit
VSWPLTLEKRLEPSAWLQFVLPALAIVIGLLLGAILLSMLGTHPWEAYQAMGESQKRRCHGHQRGGGAL